MDHLELLVASELAELNVLFSDLSSNSLNFLKQLCVILHHTIVVFLVEHSFFLKPLPQCAHRVVQELPLSFVLFLDITILDNVLRLRLLHVAVEVLVD